MLMLAQLTHHFPCVYSHKGYRPSFWTSSHWALSACTRYSSGSLLHTTCQDLRSLNSGTSVSRGRQSTEECSESVLKDTSLRHHHSLEHHKLHSSFSLSWSAASISMTSWSTLPRPNSPGLVAVYITGPAVVFIIVISYLLCCLRRRRRKSVEKSGESCPS
jgi:hypothetical protein